VDVPTTPVADGTAPGDLPAVAAEAARGPRPDSAAYALEVVGERWTLLVVRELMLGTHRYEQIKHATGAPRDQLSARLKTLVAAGVVERRQYAQRPTRYEYHLTEAGRALRPILLLLKAWGDRHVLGGAAPPSSSRHTCGAPFDPVAVCGYCGEPESGDGLTTRWSDPAWPPVGPPGPASEGSGPPGG
jgi:DNA-binding HxlR family transcriptional regulator